MKNKIITFIIIALLSVALKASAGVVQPYATSAAAIELLDPCGKQSPMDEVFLRVNGHILTVRTYIDPFLADPQSYFMEVPNIANQLTRDGTNCVISVNNGVLTD